MTSPAHGNTVRSWNRVLRGGRRRPLRSVDRNYAGRNAKPEGSSVKGLSPVKQHRMWWPSYYSDAKAIPGKATAVAGTGTTGVRDHGMYRRLSQELGRASGGGAWTQLSIRRQGLTAKSETSPPEAVRWFHSSKEVR